MKIKMFCQTVAGQANQPGASSKVLRLVAVPAIPAQGERAAVPSPNAALFVGGQGGGTLDCSNLAKATHEEFEEGKVYVVEIREAGPKD